MVLSATKMAAVTVDSSASFPATPCVLYRNLSSTVSVPQSTPIYISYDNTIAGGTTQSSSFAAQDALYNFIHFIKLS
jgi:hypothetical protein